jgi:hypothetical protein
MSSLRVLADAREVPSAQGDPGEIGECVDDVAL